MIMLRNIKTHKEELSRCRFHIVKITIASKVVYEDYNNIEHKNAPNQVLTIVEKGKRKMRKVV